MNPAHGVRARDFGVKLATRRQGFTAEQVRQIFDALNGENAAFAWVVRLLAYHGMRSGEACQLRAADATVLHDIPVLRVHDLYGRVKNRASVRDIPIHPACIDILRVARDVEPKCGADAWLFPSLPAKKLGRGRWFQDHGSRFLREKVTRHAFLSAPLAARWHEGRQKVYRGGCGEHSFRRKYMSLENSLALRDPSTSFFS